MGKGNNASRQGLASAGLRRRVAAGFASFLVGVLGSLPRASLAQTVPPNVPPPDPLMSLMLAQPRIDIDSAVIPETSFDPPVVRAGDEAVYRVTFNALETSIQLPPKLAGVPPLQLHPTAHGQLLVITGTNYQPRTTFNYRVRPAQAGQLVIPSFTARVYGKSVAVPAARLAVVRDLPALAAGPQTLRLAVTQTNVYAGQAVRASVTLPPSTALMMQSPSPLQVLGQGFIVDPHSLRPRVEVSRLGPGNAAISSIAYDFVFTPIASGKLTARAQAFVGSRLLQPMNMTAGNLAANGPQYTLVDSDPVSLEVLPLPREGQLAGFTGAVGIFAAGPPQLATNILHVGDPVRLQVKIRGEGNLVRLVAPPPPQVREWRMFPGEANTTHPQIIHAQGFTIFNYILVPLTERANSTPAIPFSCFDPVEGRYVDCTIPPVSVTVLPGDLVADLPLLLRADAAAGSRDKELVLSGLSSSLRLTARSLVPSQRQAWFPVVQLAPAAFFAALWAWDRRRRYLEAHPEVVRRRRARRALRRQWRVARKAAAQRNAPEFAAAVVSALRIACSPYYPAEPRALVGSDVLALLPEGDRAGREGQMVRKFFDTADAAQFSLALVDAAGLLALEGEAERLLRSLEERLCR